MRQVKIYILLLVLPMLAIKVEAQIINLFRKLDAVRMVRDTVISLRYYKNADAELIEKLDSFTAHLSAKPDYNLDSNFFYTISFVPRDSIKNKIKIYTTYNYQYVDYSRLTDINKKHINDRVFAFFFYKEKLILCTLDNFADDKFYRGYPNHKRKNGVYPKINGLSNDMKLLKNLINEHVSSSVKKEIDRQKDEYNITADPWLIQGYYLKD